MSTSSPVVERSTLSLLAERFHRAQTTPGRLWAAGFAVAMAALLFCVTVLAAVASHVRGMQTVGKDAAPSIIAAERIKASLADMHAQAANTLLYPPGKELSSVKMFEQRHREASEDILKAAGNVTYGEAELTPLRNLLNALGRYDAAIAQAFVLHAKGDRDFLRKQRDADRILHESLLPAATALDTANRVALDKGYKEQQLSATGWLVAVILTGGLLLAVLGVVQRFLYRRMRRLVNPALLTASVLTLGFLIWTVAALWSEEKALKVAKEDAFDSIHSLWQARADAYDANAAESLWLLDRDRAAEHEKVFLDQSARLATPPDGMPAKVLMTEVEAGRIPKSFKGHLAEELRNITFAGEREAAVETLRTFLNYYEIDGEIRRLEKEGKHAEALALCVGEKPGESNWAFEQFDTALGRTIDLNQKEFERVVDRGLRTLNGFDLFAPVAALAVAALTYLGLRPRLREYAA
jgi:hypothetical protein